MPEAADPGRATTLNREGNAHKEAGRPEMAEDSYRRALQASPDHPSALYNLGVCLYELGRRREAEGFLRRVVELDPADSHALFQLGALLCDDARFAEAAGTLRAAAALWPDNPLLYFYLGIAQVRSGSPWEAIASLRRALALEPDYPNAHFNLGNAHSLLKESDQAISCYREACRAQPDNPLYRGSLLNEMQQACDWTQIGELIDLQRRGVSQQPPQPIHPFQLLSIPSTRSEQLQCARNFAAHQLQGLEQERQRLSFSFARRPSQGRIRLGYLSADFHEHPVAYLLAEVFELHDRERFEVVAYSCGPESESPTRARLRRAFDRFVDLRTLSNADAAATIHAHGVDILVDLGGYTTNARTEVAALRPAPIQASFIGFAGTSGAPFIDYLVADRFVIPPGHESDYSEQLVLMPASFQANDRKRLVAQTPSRRQLGLAEDSFVFCCFNQPYKILPELFETWMRLLHAVPASVLWLRDSNDAATRNLRRAARAAGIDADRLVFAPSVENYSLHLGRFAAADLFLDSFPYNAHTTASDALWTGLPVLTCAGETFASRVAGSLLHAVGLPELVTSSPAEYERLALRLAGTPGELRQLRSRLRENRGAAPLFDTPRFTRDLEAAYLGMWQEHAAGRPPRRIEF
ncbi:MAG TPA: tetratricopeptide repeat protein [Burkholderiales bacterium]|nr:tetratricopeptide repeat protein [Burkholderiales bacterium]